ncbi:DUF7507 domain-containing protein, partial [Fontibacter flavus]
MKTIIKSFSFLILIISYLGINYEVNAQTGCSSQNVTVSNFVFTDANGDPFAADLDLPLGTPVNGQIQATFGGTSGNGYSVYVEYDVFINDQFVGQEILCLFPGTRVVLGVPITIDTFTWNWGDKFELKNFFMSWKTNAGGTCEKLDRSSNCWFSAPGFLVRTPLVANFDFETNCDDFEVNFENLTTGGNNAAYSYTWDFAGLGSSTLANPSFTFPGAGNYNVTLTSGDGATSKSITKTVQLFPLLDASYTKTDSDCINDNSGSITLTVEGGKGPYTYLWSTTNGSGLVAGQKDQTGLSSGTYDVTITDDRGCFETLQIVIAQPNTAPDPTDFVDESVCENSGPLGYNITADPGYRLIFYDSETSTTPLATVPSVDTNTSGDGTFSVWASQINDDECESDRVEVKITVNPLPVLMITDPAPVCEPGTVDLTAAAVTSGSSGFNSLGYFSDADANSELTDPTAVDVSGTYYIKATSTAGCFVIQPVVVVINEAPAAPTSRGDLEACATDPIQTLTALADVPAGFTIVWYDQAEGGSQVSAPTLNSIGTKTYYAEAVNSTTGCVSLERTAVTLTINDCRVSIVKSVNFEQINGPTTLDYTITVTNPGNVPLTGVVVTDPFTNGTTALTLSSGDANGNNELDTNENWEYTTSYVVSQAMIDAGDDLVNTAFVNTNETSEQSATATTTITQSPSLTISKTVDATNISAPQDLNYTITVTNTGNVSLTGVAVTDPFAGGAALESGDANNNGVLDIGEAWVYSAVYAATQSDIDAGDDLVNTAFVNTNETSEQSATATTTITQNASLTISK